MPTSSPDDAGSSERPSTALAEEAFDAAGRPQGAADPPQLIVLSGEPLAGKSHLARRLVERAAEPVLHVENDALRPAAARILGDDAPTYSGPESYLTYATAWALAERALGRNVHVVLDGTNLTDRGRRGAYDVADAAGAPVLVVRVEAPAPVVEARVARARKEAPWRVRAHEALHGHAEPMERCSRPWVAVEVAPGRAHASDFASVDQAVGALRGLPWFAWVGPAPGEASRFMAGTAFQG